MLCHILLAVALVGDTAAFFAPDDDCRAQVIQHISEARHTILVQASTFTDPDIAKALVAKARPTLGMAEPNCQVIVIIDKAASLQKGCQAENCEKEGLAIRIDSKHKFAPSMVFIIDCSPLHPDDHHAKVLTRSIGIGVGSQEHDTESLLLIWNDPSTITAYFNNWQKHRDHSEAFVPKQKSGRSKLLRTADGELIDGTDSTLNGFRELVRPNRRLELKPSNRSQKK